MSRVDYYNDPNAPKANSIAIAVSAFVLNDNNELLMIRRTDNDLYSIPGGQLELGETLTQATMRELYEETGIDIRVTELVGIYSNPDHVIAYDDGEVRQQFSVCFRATPTGGQLRTSSESAEAMWVAQAHLPELRIHPSTMLRITHGYEYRRQPFYT